MNGGANMMGAQGAFPPMGYGQMPMMNPFAAMGGFQGIQMQNGNGAMQAPPGMNASFMPPQSDPNMVQSFDEFVNKFDDLFKRTVS